MATYWANLALAPVNGFSILNHLPMVYVPTRVEDNVLERARVILRQEFSSSAPLPEPLLLFSEAHTVAELVFFATEWYRLGASAAKPPIEFCLDTLADKVYPEVREPFVRPGRCVTCLRADCFRFLARAECDGRRLASTGCSAGQLRVRC